MNTSDDFSHFLLCPESTYESIKMKKIKEVGL